MKHNQVALRVGTVVAVVLLAGCVSPPRAHPSVEISDALLTATGDAPVIVDVHYVEGRFPQEYSLDALRHALEGINGRGTVQEGMVAEFAVEDASADKVWNYGDIARIHANLQETGCFADWRCIRFIFLNGELDNGESRPYGSSLGDTAFVFPDRMNYTLTHAGPLRPPNLGLAEMERKTVIHELGHMLGLVNSATPMLEARLAPKDRDPCQCHSNQEDSPMYYHAPSSWDATRDVLLGTDHFPFRFNAADMRDLRAQQDWLREAMENQ